MVDTKQQDYAKQEARLVIAKGGIKGISKTNWHNVESGQIEQFKWLLRRLAGEFK